MAPLGGGSQEDVYPLKGMGAVDGRGRGRGRTGGADLDRRDEERGEGGDNHAEREEIDAEERGGQVVGGRWDGGVYGNR